MHIWINWQHLRRQNVLQKLRQKIDDRAVICIRCGCAFNGGVFKPDDVPGVGTFILFDSSRGLVLFAVHYKETPQKANVVLTWAVVSMVIGAFYGCALML